MEVVNSTTLLILGVAKRTLIKLRNWAGQIDFVIVKMDDFDIVLRMNFLPKNDLSRQGAH